MRSWVKSLLFISAYTPLFLILILQYMSSSKTWLVAGLIFLCIINLIWVLIYIISKKWTIKGYTVKKSVNRTSDALNYIIAYIITFLGFSFNTWQDYISFIILFVIIFYIYINSDLIFVNPLLNVLGFKIISVELNEGGGEIVLITKNSSLKTNDKIYVKNITDNIYLMENRSDYEYTDSSSSKYENKEEI